MEVKIKMQLSEYEKDEKEEEIIFKELLKIYNTEN